MRTGFGQCIITAAIVLASSAALADQNDVVKGQAPGSFPSDYERAKSKATDGKVCGYIYQSLEQQKVGNGWSEVQTTAMGPPVRIDPCKFPAERNGKFASAIAALRKVNPGTKKLVVVVADGVSDWSYRKNAAEQVVSRDITIKLYQKDFTVRLWCGLSDPDVACEQMLSDDLGTIAAGLNEAQYRLAEGAKHKSTDATPDAKTMIAPATTCQLIGYRVVGISRAAKNTIAKLKRKSEWNPKSHFLLRDGTTKSADDVEKLLDQAETDGAALFKSCNGTIELPKELVIH